MYKAILAMIFLVILPFSAMAEGDGTIHDIFGKVWVNGIAADKYSAIHFGDQVVTGGLSGVTIILDGSVYRVANSTRLRLPKGKENFTIGFPYGAFLAVFRHNTNKTVYTRTAVLGVRGTGFYLSDRGSETYLCTCYGDIDFIDGSDAGNQGHVHGVHHEVVTFDHDTYTFKDDIMKKHTDEDLFALEKLVGRTPPEEFSGSNEMMNSFEMKPQALVKD